MKHRTIVAFTAIIIMLLATPISARAAPVLSTDQPLYTIRDKSVTLGGSDLSQGQKYYVWLKTPADNRTRYTNTSFLPVSGGLVPPDIEYQLNPNVTLGTYLVSLSTSSAVDNAQAIAHFGVWGTAQPVYQRTETVNILGGGIFPSTGLRLTIRDPAGNIVNQATFPSTAYGNFNETWKVPKDAVTNVFTAFIDGTGVFDNAQQDFVSQAKFTVTQAVLSLKVYQEPNSTYQRTQNAALSMAIQYPDGSPVTSSASNIQPVILLQNQTTAAFANLTVVDSANGVWQAESKILANATTSGRYRFEIPAMSFDDGHGNKGGAKDTYSNFFSVTNASLSITSQLNGTNIQIPFGQVSIMSKVTYPDGSPLTAGAVAVVVTSGNSVSQLQSAYDPTIGEWRSTYSSTLLDLAHVGMWTLRVTARDSYGNSGKATYNVAAQPYLFIVLVASVLAVLSFARWSISRYGRRVYFRIRKLVRSPRSRRFR